MQQSHLRLTRQWKSVSLRRITIETFLRSPEPVWPSSLFLPRFSGLDWFPALLAAAGDTTIKKRLLKGAAIGDQQFRVHLDGDKPARLLLGKSNKEARTDFAYFNDDGVLGYSQWQVTDDDGADARNPNVHDQVHAVGGQLGYAMPKRSIKTLNPLDNIWGGTHKGTSIFLSVRRFKHSLPDAGCGVFQAPG